MNTRPTTRPTGRRVVLRALALFTVLAMLLPASAIARAGSASPFVGDWRATDAGDGSEIRVSIAGPPAGPFRITWTEEYISFCAGGPGLVRGNGWLNEADAHILEADMRAECKISGASIDFRWTWAYQPASDKLSSRDSKGAVTIWSHPGHPFATPPELNLRVNYGSDDWVESFYEPGHTAWIAVTDAEGGVVATTQLVTEWKWYWGGYGFTSLDGVWLDPDGSPMEYAPDIKPSDWVFGWMDNGASAQVQIGTITGTIDLAADSIQGAVDAQWFGAPVPVECLDWGSGGNPYPNQDGGSILPNGLDTYSCSWFGDWDIQPGQAVGVAYTGLDGNWVANAFRTRHSIFYASEAGDWLWTQDFAPLTSLQIAVFESGDSTVPLWEGQAQTDPSGFALELFSDLPEPFDLQPGNYVTVADDDLTKGLVLLPMSVTVFDTETDYMEGTAPAGADVWVAAGLQSSQEGMWVTADAEGVWYAYFAFDITEEMHAWSYAQIYDGDGDVNEADPPW